MLTVAQIREQIIDRQEGRTRKPKPSFYGSYRLGHYVVLQELRDEKLVERAAPIAAE